MNSLIGVRTNCSDEQGLQEQLPKMYSSQLIMLEEEDEGMSFKTIRRA